MEQNDVYNNIPQVVTRFRSYQLGIAGSSFSYFANSWFTLIEAMATDLSKPQLLAELKACNKQTIDTLHVTSWDQDHCSASALEWILTELTPSLVETPGYTPHTDSGAACAKLIHDYRNRWTAKGRKVNVRSIDPSYIKSLGPAQALGYKEILYHPKELREKPNDNSTIKFFRSGAFNVLSLGDVEDPAIAAMLKRCKTLCREIDVLILPHHGADNGFTTKNLLQTLSPTLAICSSNYGNQFDHPRQAIRDLLYQQAVPLFTTKTGDVVIQSIGGHTVDYHVANLIADSTEISSTRKFRSRKSRLLMMNLDAVRNVMKPGFKGLK
jgi:competence protein ComEC